MPFSLWCLCAQRYQTSWYIFIQIEKNDIALEFIYSVEKICCHSSNRKWYQPIAKFSRSAKVASSQLSTNDIFRNPVVNLSIVRHYITIKFIIASTVQKCMKEWIQIPFLFVMEYYCPSVPSVGIYMQNRRKKWKNLTWSSLK